MLPLMLMGVIASGSPRAVAKKLMESTAYVSLVLTGLLIPEPGRVADGQLIRGTAGAWAELVRVLGSDWTRVREVPAEKLEEIVAGGFKKAGFHEVILTPRSGDHGRDVIAIKRGVGSIKILGSVKAYKPGHLVDYDHMRALLGVVNLDPAASKGLIATTSDFPPRLANDPINAAIPTRLELMNGEALRDWLLDLANGKSECPEGHDAI
jgi:restriction system protein